MQHPDQDKYDQVTKSVKPMVLNIDPDWLLRMAEKEDGKIISVGGFFYRQDEYLDVLENERTPIIAKNKPGA